MNVIAEVALSMAEFSENIAALASCDMSKQLSHTLSVLADVQRRAKELQDLQAREDVSTIMSTGGSNLAVWSRFTADEFRHSRRVCTACEFCAGMYVLCFYSIHLPIDSVACFCIKSAAIHFLATCRRGCTQGTTSA